jgi:hypothetical protein
MSPRRLVWVLAVPAASLTALGPTLRAVDYLLERNEATPDEVALWARLFDLSTEANVPTWYANTLLVLLALAFVVVGRVRAAVRTADSRAWYGFAAVALLLALDESSGLHEQVLGQIGGRTSLGSAEGVRHSPWLIAAAPVVAVLGGLCWSMGRRIERSLRRRLLVSAGVYFGGAVGAEAMSALVHEDSGHGRLYVAVTAVEEGLELAGVLLALYAVASCVRIVSTSAGVLLVPADVGAPAPKWADRRERGDHLVAQPQLREAS